MTSDLREVVGLFHDAEALEGAAQTLMSNGFDRALLSLIATEATVKEKFGSRVISAEHLADDENTPRIGYADHADLGIGEGALIGGLFYVGAIVGSGTVIASGGAALPAVVAAAAGGLGAGGVGAFLASVLHKGVADKVSEEVERGGLILWVRTQDDAQEARAIQIMKDSGGYDVHARGEER